MFFKKEKVEIDTQVLIEMYRYLSEYELLLKTKENIQQEKLNHIKELKEQINDVV